MATKRGSLRYRGYLEETSEGMVESCRIAVEVRGTLGWRKVADLEPPPTLAFSWGSGPGGTGPGLTGGAVLTDALGVPVGAPNHLDPHRRLARDFTEDVIAHLPRDEPWQLHRETVLWWVRGWYVGQRDGHWPQALSRWARRREHSLGHVNRAGMASDGADDARASLDSPGVSGEAGMPRVGR